MPMPEKENDSSKVMGLSMWPISNFAGMASMPAKPTPDTAKKFAPGYEIKPYHTSLTDWIQGSLRIIPYMAITLLSNYFYPVDQMMKESDVAIQGTLKGDYDIMKHGWLAKMAIRDLIVTLICAAGWQWIVVGSPFQPRLNPLKFNKDYQAEKHLKREMFYTVCTILCGTIWEAIAMYWYSTGFVTSYNFNINEYPKTFWTMYITAVIWRDGYFWWCHRAMHNWDTKYIPDIGKWLYDNAHSVHHKSRNIQPWSGISMHPIEGIIYESAIALPLLFTHHPIMLQFIKIDLNYAAIMGHDGHEYPAAGDWFHTIHHMNVKNNYGSANCPFDWFFGTLDYGDTIDLEDENERYMKKLEAQEIEDAKKNK